jgi:hypothetical protein
MTLQEPVQPHPARLTRSDASASAMAAFSPGCRDIQVAMPYSRRRSKIAAG